MLNFLDLSKLMNDPVRHNSSGPLVPTKLPLNIPKFEGKVGDDPRAHVTTFHLWCYSNSQNDDTVQLILLETTLTNTAAKWYIEFPSATFDNFWDLDNVFLSHLQLPIWYDFRIDLFSTFR